MPAKQHKKVIERVNAAFARNDVEGFLAHCADDFSWTMVGDKPIVGKDAIRKWMASSPPEPPRFSVDALVGEGDLVIAQGEMTMNENGATVPYSYCDVWRFRGEQLVELKAYVIKTSAQAQTAAT